MIFSIRLWTQQVDCATGWTSKYFFANKGKNYSRPFAGSAGLSIRISGTFIVFRGLISLVFALTKKIEEDSETLQRSA